MSNDEPACNISDLSDDDDFNDSSLKKTNKRHIRNQISGQGKSKTRSKNKTFDNDSSQDETSEQPKASSNSVSTCKLSHRADKAYNLGDVSSNGNC